MWMNAALLESIPSFLIENIPEIKTSDIEQMLSAVNFDTGDLLRSSSHRFEGKRAIPMMTVSFHHHIFEKGMVPSPEEYLSEYEDENKFFLATIHEDDISGVRHRVMRAYPSLIRDVHFICECREMGHQAIRTVMDDISGVDARIPMGESEIKVRLYYDSPKSRSHKKKAFSHIMGPDHYDLGLKKGDCLKVGDFMLYHPDAIRSFLASICFEEGNLHIES